MISTNITIEKRDPFTDCTQCHTSLVNCQCKCPYCEKRDECECVLFDAVTGG